MPKMMQGGRTREAVEAVCEHCHGKFLRRADAYGQRRVQLYCCTDCSRAARRSRVSVECAMCGDPLEVTKARFANSKSGMFFCCKSCKDAAARLDGGLNEVWPAHYGNGLSGCSIRNRSGVSDRVDAGCVECGEKRGYMITVHHIDGDRFHNEDASNFEVLCWNHHITRHLRLINGEWKFSPKSLTPREMLLELCS